MEFLMGCGSSVAAETGNSLLAKLKLHIGYLIHYNNNMKGLSDARDNLEIKRSDASRFVADASTEFRDLSSTVTHWQNEAETLHNKAETIINENNRRSSCLSPWSCYSSSKKAWELTQQINEKVQSAPDFGTTFDRPAPETGARFNLTGSMDFGSRLTILDDVLEALKDEKVSMCSICGMGGVGKTTLAKKLIQRVETLHLFDKVVMVTVTQYPNMEKIQNEIIENLGLKIVESSVPIRANRLKEWLKIKNNKTLLVLDDVWRKLDDELEEIGILPVSNRCKIVFTSRNEDECKEMGSQPNFRVNNLEGEEAWDLFREKAGKRTEDLKLLETARKIAAECGGLPIAIVTIATALKYKPEATWKDSLLRLQKSNLSEGMSDMEKVYARIGLSYDLLNAEAKSCFRLCCLYPEDYNIPIEDLVLYGKSLDLFDSVDTMNQARYRVDNIIHELKASFLLLDGDEYECVKMHDILRDFAVSLSSKAEDMYLTKCENTVMTQWPETNKYKNCSAISIMCAQMQEHPVDLECPKLGLLQLIFVNDSKPLQDNVFEGMKELKVLSLKVPSVSQPLNVTKKLRTLCVTETLDYWQSKYLPEQIGVLLGDHLMNLESFSYSTERPCKDFPVEIGFLCNLRFLRLSGVEFRYIPPGVLPKLVKLEELYLPWKFRDWGCKDYRNRINADLDEIESLPLTALEIGIKEGSILGEKLVEKLERFEVYVGKDFLVPLHDFRKHNRSKTLFEAVEVDACVIRASWISALLRKSESLLYIEVRNLKNINLELENNGFEQLRKINIRECKEMEYLVDTAGENISWSSSSSSFSQLESLELYSLYNLKEICHFGPIFSKIEPTLLFPNLTEISIDVCPKLKSVFPSSVARGLRKVQRMKIRGSYKMEKCFCTDEVDDDKQKIEENSAEEVDAVTIIFPQLKVLELNQMFKLRVFYDDNHAIKLPSLESLTVYRCEEMEALSYRSCTIPKLQQIRINNLPFFLGEQEDVNALLKRKVFELRNTYG